VGSSHSREGTRRGDRGLRQERSLGRSLDE
jgi:hypothetical protein